MDAYKQFYSDLRKIQDQYNYESRGYGSINIYDMRDDDTSKRVAGVNWSCNGTVDVKHAKSFATALIDAVEACERFNATHDMDDI